MIRGAKAMRRKIFGSFLVMACLSLSLIAILAADASGQVSWKFTIGSAVKSSPAMVMNGSREGQIYVGAADGKLYAVSIPEHAGIYAWAVLTTGGAISSSPALGGDGTIYVGSDDGNLYAVGPDGTRKWAFPTGSPISSSPALGSDDTIYVSAANGKLYAVNPDGTRKWVCTTGSEHFRVGWVTSSPAVGADGTIYVGSADGNLYAVSPDGARKWVFTTEGPVCSSPALAADGTIYVGSLDGKLYAVKPDGTSKWAFIGGGWDVLLPGPGQGWRHLCGRG
jgi:outer membrane protein assembly factor BamB